MFVFIILSAGQVSVWCAMDKNLKLPVVLNVTLKRVRKWKRLINLLILVQYRYVSTSAALT